MADSGYERLVTEGSESHLAENQEHIQLTRILMILKKANSSC